MNELIESGGRPEHRHRAAAPVGADPTAALDRAIAALSTVGFRIEDRRPDSARLTGPRLTSTRQNPLLGAGTVELTAGHGELALDADLAGTRFLRQFVTWFPPLLVLALTLPWLVLVAVGVLPPAQAIAPAVVAGLQLPLWLALGPLIRRRIIRGTEQALDTLVHNSAFGS